MTANEAYKREISFCSQESRNSSNGEEGIEDRIEITINSIENIIRDSTLTLKFTVEHEDITLGESEQIKINPVYGNISQVYSIDFTVTWPYVANYIKSIVPIVSTPILIKVFEISENNDLSGQAAETKSKNKAQTKLKRSSSKIEPKIETKLLGMCNIDLLPIILGEIICDEKLILEVPSYSWDNRAMSWANLPRISITMRSSDDSVVIAKDKTFNFLNITVESIYNVPSFFTSDMQYKCGTVLHTENSEDDSRIIFEAGKLVEFHDVERMKTWRALQHLDSRAKFSKYKICCDYDVVKNEFKEQFKLKEAVNKDNPRIEWNAMQRTLLEAKDIENMKDRLRKYKYWPFQIMVAQKQRNSKVKAIEEPDKVIYQCYVDVSQLLFPGRTKSRVLAQLYTQSSSEMEEKTGLNINIFDNESNQESVHRKSGVSGVSEDFLENSEFQEYIPSMPVFTENGEPVLILIEFTLYRPFLDARVLEDYTEALEILKNKPKPKEPCYIYTPDLAQEQYINCIQYLVDFLDESYRDFLQQCDCKEKDDSMSTAKVPSMCTIHKIKNPNKVSSNAKSFITEDTTCPYFYLEDELSRFKQFLHESGKYVKIRNRLKNQIINLLDQKFAINSSEWYSTKNQNFVASCYTYLVEQMHTALNTKLDVRLAEKYPNPVNPQELWLRAEEAYEFEDYEKAEKLIGKIVSDNRKNPDAWIKYASYFMRRCNIDEATECCREAIRLDSRHRLALIFYGIILAMKEEYTDAEVFLKGVTSLYPRFAEAWAILHLLYVKIQYYPGIDITLAIAEKCLKDRTQEIELLEISKAEPIAWSTTLCRKNRIFHRTAVLLLKLHLYNFAALALTQDVCHGERTVEPLYFLGVNYYLQGSYKTALEYLHEAESIIGLEYSVAALMGHSHFKSGNISQAIEHFESVDMMYDRPEDIHLVHLRMGFYYLDIEKYEQARNVFLRACKDSPSCKTWLGVGISSYHLEKLDESEIALTEANRIDGEDPDVWGYLCLLSMSLHRYEEFTQCYRQMVKNNLRSDKLWRHTQWTLWATRHQSLISEDQTRNSFVK